MISHFLAESIVISNYANTRPMFMSNTLNIVTITVIQRAPLDGDRGYYISTDMKLIIGEDLVGTFMK